jgi:hypothetical protein
MRGAIPPSPSTPSWRGAQFKINAQGKLYLSLYLRETGLEVLDWIHLAHDRDQ